MSLSAIGYIVLVWLNSQCQWSVDNSTGHECVFSGGHVLRLDVTESIENTKCQMTELADTQSSTARQKATKGPQTDHAYGQIYSTTAPFPNHMCIDVGL